MVYDGTSTTSEAYLQFGVMPSIERLSEVFVNQNLWGERLELAHRLVEVSYKDIRYINEVLQRSRLAPANWGLKHRFLSQDQFFASAFMASDAPPTFEVYMSVGIPVILCSVASEMDLYENHEGLKQGTLLRHDQTSIECWFPWVDKDKGVSEVAIRTALDSTLLTYFHEIAHVLFGHCRYKPTSSDEERAIEADADFQAGTMFSLWISHLSDARKSVSVDETIDRLVRAGFLLSTIFKRFSAKTSTYHFPSTRLLCFYAGAAFGMMKSGGTPNFQSDDEGNAFWDGRVAEVSDSLLNALRKSSLEYFAGTEEDIRNDIANLNSVTCVVRDRLKDGPLKKLMIPVMK